MRVRVRVHVLKYRIVLISNDRKLKIRNFIPRFSIYFIRNFQPPKITRYTVLHVTSGMRGCMGDAKEMIYDLRPQE